MYMIKHNELDMYVVPVAFDHMLYLMYSKTTEDASYFRENGFVRFETEKNLSSDYLSQLIKQIKDLNCVVCLDMRYVSSYVSRGFAPIKKQNLPVIFANVFADNVGLRNRLKSDISELKVYENCPEVLCTENESAREAANRKNFLEEIEALYQEKTRLLLNSVAIEKDDQFDTLLESSSVYVNCYIALKKLFLDIENALFIVYRMAQLILTGCEDWREATLICCSKTGAAFTSLLSAFLGIPAVYCINIGPKFALDVVHLKKEVKEGQNYIYVFDFLCMGTEAKILYALLSILGANLIYGVGVANYLNISAPEFVQSIFGRFRTLIHIPDVIPHYAIRPIVKRSEEI